MADIVERLRTEQPSYVLIGDAAIEIERLQKQAHYHYENGLKKDVEIDRLREEVMAWWKETEIMRSDLAIYSEQIERQQKALQWIAGCEGGDIFDMCKEMRDTANAALKEGE